MSSSSVNRYRKEILCFNCKPPKIKQFLTDENKIFRKEFSYSILTSENIETDSFIFSDESSFCLCNDGCWRWYRKGEKSKDVYDYKTKYDRGQMVYGAIGLNYKSKLVIIKNGIGDIQYRKILEKSDMFDELKLKYGTENYIFIQDGAPAHTSYLTKWFLKKRCNFLKSWPSNSPDLNPIEHLWGTMKRILKNYRNLTKNQMINKIIQIWDEFPQDKINKLVFSFKKKK